VISPETRPNHIEHIHAKIRVTSRAAAAPFAIQHGLPLPTSNPRHCPPWPLERRKLENMRPQTKHDHA